MLTTVVDVVEGGGAVESRQREGRGKLKKKLSMLLVMLLMLALSAAPALAQEGQVERGPEHANSICSFSGLNDTPDDPEEGGRVQSYGQLVRQDAAEPSAQKGLAEPGEECNAHNHPLQEGGPEE